MLERLLAHWPLKLLSFAIAVAIWLSVTGESPIVQDLTVPVNVTIREGRILAAPPGVVTVRLSGPQRVLRQLDGRSLVVNLDLTDVRLGERDVQLTRSDLQGVPNRVMVDFFDPPRVHLVVDRRLRREISVVPHLIGELPDGFHLYHTRLRPDTVQIEGPASEVAEIERLTTDPIVLNNHREAFTERVGAVTDRPGVIIVDPTLLEARVIVDADPEPFELEVPLQFPGFDGAVEISPGSVRVKLHGPGSLLQRLTPGQVRASVDVTELEPGGPVQRLPVMTQLANLLPDQMARLSIESASPSQVGVRLSAEEGAP